MAPVFYVRWYMYFHVVVIGIDKLYAIEICLTLWENNIYLVGRKVRNLYLNYNLVYKILIWTIIYFGQSNKTNKTVYHTRYSHHSFSTPDAI